MIRCLCHRQKTLQRLTIMGGAVMPVSFRMYGVMVPGRQENDNTMTFGHPSIRGALSCSPFPAPGAPESHITYFGNTGSTPCFNFKFDKTVSSSDDAKKGNGTLIIPFLKIICGSLISAESEFLRMYSWKPLDCRRTRVRSSAR